MEKISSILSSSRRSTSSIPDSHTMRPGVFNPFSERKDGASSDRKDVKYNPSSVDSALALHRQARDGRTRDQAEVGMITRSTDSFFGNSAPLAAETSFSNGLIADSSSKKSDTLNVGPDDDSSPQGALHSNAGADKGAGSVSGSVSGNGSANLSGLSKGVNLSESLKLANNKEALLNGTSSARPSFESVLAHPVTTSSGFTNLGTIEDDSDLKYMPKGSLLNVMA